MFVGKALLVLGAGLFVAGCATSPRSVPVDEIDPQEKIAVRAASAREAGGFVTIGEASALTLPVAQDRALREARAALADIVSARLEKLKNDYVESAGIADAEPVQAWFAGANGYLRDLILGGARPVLEKSAMEDERWTVWVLLVEDPGVLVQALELRGIAERQLFGLLRASQAYRALLVEAERFAEYRTAQN